VLLYPEGMVKLNTSAGEILSRCDGERTLTDIIANLEQTFGATGLSGDVTAFVSMALENRWIEMRT
jgi:pyrroloquinoline quinone biosynthesis protein D